MGDFNSDKHTDLFILNNENATSPSPSWSVEIWLWNAGSNIFEFNPTPSARITSSLLINNVVAGDFNYDGRLDLLVSGAAYDSWNRPVTWMELHYGNYIGFETEFISLPPAIDHVLVCDLNNDLRLDLFGATYLNLAPGGLSPTQLPSANVAKNRRKGGRRLLTDGSADMIEGANPYEEEEIAVVPKPTSPTPNPHKTKPVRTKSDTPTATAPKSISSSASAFSKSESTADTSALDDVLIAEESSPIAIHSSPAEKDEDRTSVQRTYWLNRAAYTTSGFIGVTFELKAQNLDQSQKQRFLPESGAYADGNARGLAMVPPAQLASPHSHAAVDIDGDCMADLIITSADSKNKYVEIWLNTAESGPVFHSISALPQGSGQLSVADLDHDGNIDILVPVFSTDNKNNEIFLFYNRAIQLCDSQYDLTSGNGPCRSNTNLCLADLEFYFDFMETLDASNFAFSSNLAVYQFPSEMEGGHMYNPYVASQGIFNPASQSPFQFRLGDINLDGYPDLLLALTPNPLEEGLQFGIVELWLNQACPTSDSSAGGLPSPHSESIICGAQSQNRGRRILSPQGMDSVNNVLSSINGAFAGASFFDIADDGQMDILFSAIAPPLKNDGSNTAAGTHSTHVFVNNWNEDAYFLTCIASNGVCPAWCDTEPKFPNPKPYGVNQVGATFKFSYTDLTGVTHISIGAQLPQSGYLSLTTPYLTFGLGRTNTFIDAFQFGIGLNQSDPTTPHTRSWVSMVPNAQVIVFPYPPSKPDEWTMELFVSPSTHLFWVCISWAATLTLLAIIIGFLHLKEKREDEKEKKKHQLLFTF